MTGGKEQDRLLPDGVCPYPGMRDIGMQGFQEWFEKITTNAPSMDLNPDAIVSAYILATQDCRHNIIAQPLPYFQRYIEELSGTVEQVSSQYQEVENRPTGLENYVNSMGKRIKCCEQESQRMSQSPDYARSWCERESSNRLKAKNEVYTFVDELDGKLERIFKPHMQSEWLRIKNRFLVLTSIESTAVLQDARIAGEATPNDNFIYVAIVQLLSEEQVSEDESGLNLSYSYNTDYACETAAHEALHIVPIVRVNTEADQEIICKGYSKYSHDKVKDEYAYCGDDECPHAAFEEGMVNCATSYLLHNENLEATILDLRQCLENLNAHCPPCLMEENKSRSTTGLLIAETMQKVGFEPFARTFANSDLPELMNILHEKLETEKFDELMTKMREIDIKMREFKHTLISQENPPANS